MSKNCPMCNGSGKIPEPHLKQKNIEEKRQTARTLQDQGYSLREIQKIMGYKSHRSIQQLLETTEKTTL